MRVAIVASLLCAGCSLALVPQQARKPRRGLGRSSASSSEDEVVSGGIWYEEGAKAAPRRPIIAGNWKLNPGTLGEAEALLKLVASNAKGGGDVLPEVVVFPPFPYISTAVSLLEGSGVQVGAQNVGLEQAGAFTGEVAASMVRSCGCEYVLLGHSERRDLYDETDEVINRKVLACLDEGGGLKVLLCVGETEAEFEAELLNTVVDLQVKKGLQGCTLQQIMDNRVVIAYEPVWAIGTGRVATPEQAQAAHRCVRRSLAQMFGCEAASKVRIQYGGSVTPESVEALMRMPDIDGCLVGGASLKAEAFSRIVEFQDPAALIDINAPRELLAREAVACRNALGESPVWSIRDQTLYWVSAPEGELWSWNGRDSPFRRIPRFGTTLGCVAIKAGPPGSLILGAEDAILQLRLPVNSNEQEEATVLTLAPEPGSETRPNDGRVDRQGRFVFGQYNNYHRAGSTVGENIAGEWRLLADGTLEEIFDFKFRVSNAACFFEDTMYFADTPTRKLYALSYPTVGLPLEKRLIWTMPAHLSGGPDGAQVDSAGFVWLALNGAARCVRLDPATGRVDIVVHLPVDCPTSLTFGGPDLDELFITTRGPDGGGLYRLKMPFGITGLPEPEYLSTSAGTDL